MTKEEKNTAMDRCASAAVNELLANNREIIGTEEIGGFILKQKSSGKFCFVQVKNKIAGTHQALTLYDADPSEFGDKVVKKTMEGWELVASLHTHPKFNAHPSFTDLTKLFQSFPVNYIYSGTAEALCRYELTDIGERDSEKLKAGESLPPLVPAFSRVPDSKLLTLSETQRWHLTPVTRNA